MHPAERPQNAGGDKNGNSGKLAPESALMSADERLKSIPFPEKQSVLTLF
jgi:hypothetical protein